jgi:hemoglobin-like flavoprotein
MQLLGAALKGLDDLDTLLPVVENLGRRHQTYGVADAHYDSVGAALLWTLEKGLGEAWTPAAAEAWTTLYTMISGIMRRAAAEASMQPVTVMAA